MTGLAGWAANRFPLVTNDIHLGLPNRRGIEPIKPLRIVMATLLGTHPIQKNVALQVTRFINH